MRIRTICAALAAGATIAAGCGSSDEESTSADAAVPETIAEIEIDSGPFDSDEAFIAAVNNYCDDSGVIFHRYPVYGFGAEGLAAEFETLVDLETADVAQLTSFDAPEDLHDAWDKYTDAGITLVTVHNDIRQAAKAGDVEQANALLNGASAQAVAKLEATGKKVGVDCSRSDDGLLQESPGQATDAAADAPQPVNTIEQAADEYLAAMQSGDCRQIVDAFHTQARVNEESFADPATGDCSAQQQGFAKATVAGTADFGAFGSAAIEYAPGQFSYEEFVLDPDKSNEFKHAAGSYADVNGLEAAPADNNADQVVSDFVAAVRNDDPEALNETITVETSPAGEGGFLQTGPFDKLGKDPDYAQSVVADIRTSEGVEPVLIGANQISAAYLLDMAEGSNDYVIVATHQPGSATDYGVSSYWALPPA